MITEIDIPAQKYKVQWYEWHPLGWALEWMPFATREEAEAVEQKLKARAQMERPNVALFNEGDDPKARIDELNRTRR